MRTKTNLMSEETQNPAAGLPPQAAEGAEETMSPAQAKKYRYWEFRTMAICIFGYAMFYLVRKNLSIAMPYLNSELGISKTDLGLFLTLHGMVYGVSKLVNGVIGDRVNARRFLTAGILICSICNICFGFSSGVIALGVFWILNGWFQGWGVAPCAKLMAHWVAPERFATKMTIWNTSHSIGAGLAIIVCGYIIKINWSGLFGSASMFGQHWRWCFFIPAAIAILGALLTWIFLRDTPSSVGLPEFRRGKSEKTEKTDTGAEYRAFIKKHVFTNPVIWIFSIGLFFVYVVRFAVLDWGPTMLKEHLGMDISSAGWTVAAFEVSGLVGMITSGWVTDHVFGGRASRTCVVCMIGVLLCMVGLCLIGPHTPLIVAILVLMAAGFFIYGPQALVGVAVINLATRRAAATANGFAGFFSYLSTIVSGWGVGLLVQHTGWSTALYTLVGIAFVGILLFLGVWNAKPNGYDD